MKQQEEALFKKFSSLRLFLTGTAMGGADIIPGVSGGTIAFILGIYETLLNAIKSFNIDFFKKLFTFKIKEAFSLIPWRFLISLGAGIAIAIVSLCKLLQYLLDNEQTYLFAFFFGLILASIVAVSKSVKWNFTAVISLVLGTLMGYIIVGLVPSEMPHTPIFLFFSGFIAIIAMILPGISGSFILLILGQFGFILEAVTNLTNIKNILSLIRSSNFEALFSLIYSAGICTLLPVAIGAVIGITTFARVLSWLLKHYHTVTITTLVGFMIGSLRRIWPWKETLETMIDRHGKTVPLREANILPDFFSLPFYTAITLVLIGFFFLLFINRLAISQKNLR